MSPGDCVTWQRHGVTIPARVHWLQELVPADSSVVWLIFDKPTCIPSSSGACTTLASHWCVGSSEVHPTPRAAHEAA